MDGPPNHVAVDSSEVGGSAGAIHEVGMWGGVGWGGGTGTGTGIRAWNGGGWRPPFGVCGVWEIHNASVKPIELYAYCPEIRRISILRVDAWVTTSR